MGCFRSQNYISPITPDNRLAKWNRDFFQNFSFTVPLDQLTSPVGTSHGKLPFSLQLQSFFHLKWHLGGWKFQSKPEILFQKYVLLWPDPQKCQGRQIIGKSVFFCGTVLTLGRHFLDSNSTYEAENFTVYSKFNSKNSFHYDSAPKNARGS